MIRNIHLIGEINRLHPLPLQLNCDSLPHLILALESQVKNFRKESLKYKDWVVILKDTNDEFNNITDQTFDLKWGKNKTDVYIAPKIQGAGLEAFLVGVLIKAGASKIIASVIVGITLNLVIGAVMSLLAPKPKGPGAATEQNPSFLFNGTVNAQGQGGPVPLIFGAHMTGSYVVSSETFVEEMLIAVGQIKEPQPGIVLGGSPTPTPPAPPYDDGLRGGIGIL